MRGVFRRRSKDRDDEKETAGKAAKKKPESPADPRATPPHTDDDAAGETVDISERLGSVSRFEAPPSADELRKRFARKPDEVVAEPPRAKTFEEQYSTESLYIGPKDDPSDFAETEPNKTAGASSAYFDPADPWGTLGVTPTDDWDTVVDAHRRLAVKYHPDRLVNASESERESAEQRMREINIAYTTLRRAHDRAPG